SNVSIRSRRSGDAMRGIILMAIARHEPCGSRTSGEYLAPQLAMTRINFLAFGLALTGCATQGPGPSAGPGDGSAAPPFTAGVSTLAGAGEAGNLDGDRDVTRFANPVNVAYGPDGNVYVADFDNNTIRVVEADGTTTTLIEQPTFKRPFGLAFAA